MQIAELVSWCSFFNVGKRFFGCLTHLSLGKIKNLFLLKKIKSKPSQAQKAK
jgi:hypothetical protein